MDNPSAFPNGPIYIDDGRTILEPGMTLRDYFAAKALPVCLKIQLDKINSPMAQMAIAGISSTDDLDEKTRDILVECLRESVETSYLVSKMMIEERKKYD